MSMLTLFLVLLAGTLSSLSSSSRCWHRTADDQLVGGIGVRVVLGGASHRLGGRAQCASRRLESMLCPLHRITMHQLKSMLCIRCITVLYIWCINPILVRSSPLPLLQLALGCIKSPLPCSFLIFVLFRRANFHHRNPSQKCKFIPHGQSAIGNGMYQISPVFLLCNSRSLL